MTDRWDAITTLTDPSRRALWDYVRRQDHPVHREEAADATRMSRGLAAFHLDKLVGAGLLAACYEAPRGRGRPPKMYQAVADGIMITIPERRDDLIADILAEAYTGKEDPVAVARRHGRARTLDDLAALGFQPDRGDGLVLLRNCPFHALTARHGPLICGMALAFLQGVADGADGLEAGPAGVPGGCCVAFTESR
jgi:predicted ArsR family transcriptional regulator